jgi:PAS domain S-box-containing protein
MTEGIGVGERKRNAVDSHVSSGNTEPPAQAVDVHDRLIEESERRSSAESRFQLLVEGVTDYALFMLDPTGVVTNWNTGAERIKGYRDHEIVGRHFENFYTPEDRAAGVPARALATALSEGKFEAEGERVRKDGSRFWASVVINPIRDRKGELVGFAKITRDITERRRTEENLRRAREMLAQAQKMEGIGQVAGGVAHDFNNLLTVIMGNVETAQRAVRAGTLDKDRLAQSLDNAMRGAERAASLTQRMLAFSRQQPLDPKPVDVGRLVEGMSDLLRRSLGEQVTVETALPHDTWRAAADPNQLEVCLLNLAVNARDAMPAGGRLTIAADNVTVAEGDRDAGDATPGEYVRITVRDTGTGMSPETMVRAFDPFFTTKDFGHGTGLGLSQVYGFAKQSGGTVQLASEPGRGTSVEIYLPRIEGEAEPARPTGEKTGMPRAVAGETILIVEDEHDVRSHAAGLLRELGYRVAEAGTGASALEMLAAHPDIALVLTDVGLPGGMNGRQLADIARRNRPDLRVLFTTGHARDAIVHNGKLDADVVLLAKPFRFDEFAGKVHDMLHGATRIRHVLLVEDEPLVQMLAEDQLRDLGYEVETAASAGEAISKAARMGTMLDLAVLDLGLPDRSGAGLLRELRELAPDLPILLASGQDDSAVRRRFAGESRVGVLQKPYTTEALQAAIAGLSRG